MKQQLQEKYKPEKCKCCGQSITYLLAIDLGVVQIIRAISVAIRKKGINCIHPRKEMETSTKIPADIRIAEGKLTSNEVGNLSKARFHGLIAKIKDNRGNYCLTDKGLEFLNGTYVPKYAIINKAEKRQVGYWHAEKYQCSIKDFYGTDYWEGIGFEIHEGRIVESIGKQGMLL